MARGTTEGCGVALAGVVWFLVFPALHAGKTHPHHEKLYRTTGNQTAISECPRLLQA